MQVITIIIGLILLMFSIIDWKVKAIPSILLTAMIFAIAVINPQNFFYGAVAGIMALLLYEGKFFTGVADIKVMAMLGFITGTLMHLFLFIILVLIFGMAWKIILKFALKIKSEDIAFIPVFLFVYITMALLGVI